MDPDRAGRLLAAERLRVEQLLAGLREDRSDDRSAADETINRSE